MPDPNQDEPVIAPVIHEILAGDAVGVSAIGRMIPPSRRCPKMKTAPQTVTRWIMVGHRLPNGEVVKLEAAKCSMRGGWTSSKAAVARFLARLTAAALPDGPAPAPPRPASQSTFARRAAAAAAKLEAMGC